MIDYNQRKAISLKSPSSIFFWSHGEIVLTLKAFNRGDIRKYQAKADDENIPLDFIGISLKGEYFEVDKFLGVNEDNSTSASLVSLMKSYGIVETYQVFSNRFFIEEERYEILVSFIVKDIGLVKVAIPKNDKSKIIIKYLDNSHYHIEPSDIKKIFKTTKFHSLKFLNNGKFYENK